MGIMEGDTLGSDAFRPRQAFSAFQNLSAVFGQTLRDPGAEDALKPVTEYPASDLRAFWFSDRVSHRRVFAYWLALQADPKDDFKPLMTELTITDPAITRPVLMDIRNGGIKNYVGPIPLNGR